jgi:DNA-binding transcriptional ArsR family regulator
MIDRHEIRGNTLRVYFYLLKHCPCELRDIQRGVGLSTPSLASYHLRKLSEAGMVTQNEYGAYSAVKETADKLLEGYAKVGNTIVPQFFFFALLFTILVVFFSLSALYTPSYIPYLVGVGIAMILAFWYETLRLWRKLPV